MHVFQTTKAKAKSAVHTCHVDFFRVCGTGCGSAGAVGQVAPRAIIDVFHLGLQLAQPQHDVIKQHCKGLLQVCKKECETWFSFLHQKPEISQQMWNYLCTYFSLASSLVTKFLSNIPASSHLQKLCMEKMSGHCYLTFTLI